MKLSGHKGKIHIEGTVSQIFLMGPSLCFMESRKKSLKNALKVSRFSK